MKCLLCLGDLRRKESRSKDSEAYYDCIRCQDNLGNPLIWIEVSKDDKIQKAWVLFEDKQEIAIRWSGKCSPRTSIYVGGQLIVNLDRAIKVDLTRQALREKMKMLLTFS